MIITVIYCGQKEPNFTRLSLTQDNVMHQIKGTFSEDVSGKVFRLAVIRTIKKFGHSPCLLRRNVSD